MDVGEQSVSHVELVLTVVNVIIGIVAAGMIPWAFIIERRLSRIEANLSEGLNLRLAHTEDAIRKILLDDGSLRERIAKLETHCEDDDSRK